MIASFVPWVPRVVVVTLLLGVGCHRLADEPDEPIDLEALALDACARACETFDTCDPERFVGMEPEDCMERCPMHPALHEENQCGSRQIILLRCVGDLTCEEFAASEAGNDPNMPPREFDAPCVTELYYTSFSRCSRDEPFDLDEPTPPPP